MSSSDFDMDALDSLYREVVLDHYKRPRNQAPVEEPDITAEGFNPFCGDQMSMRIRLDPERRVERVSFKGQGCSISQASTSMMSELIKGRSIEEVREVSQRFHDLLQGKDLSDEDLDRLGEAAALEGVKQFPVRIKCALLGWSALEDGIEEWEEKVGT